MSIVDRLQKFQKFSQLSVSALAKECGLKQQTLDKQIKGISDVSITTLTGILSTFPEISAEWLLRGEGEMLKQTGVDANAERVDKLIDTINLMQDVVNDRTEEIAALNERIRQLENQLKNK